MELCKADGRTLFFKDLHYEGHGNVIDVPKLEVELRYVGHGNAHSGIVLDNVVIPAIVAALNQHYIGRYARSVECGWLGKVVAVDAHGGEPLLKMHGVSQLARAINGGDIEESIDKHDVEWFTPDDVRFIEVV